MKEGWEIKKLGEVCDILGGSTPKRTESLYWDNGTYPWFTIEDIREQGHIIFDTKQKVTKIAWDKLRIFPKDTIMLCCTASLGEYAITKIQLSSNQQFNGLIIKDKNYLSPMYLMHFCATLKNKLYALSGKATIDFVSAEKVKQISIPVPPIAEQEKIVAELDCLSGIIEKKKQQLKEYDALAQSIFYEMFGDPVENEKGLPIKQLGDITNSVNYGTSSPATENGRYAYLRMNNLTYNGYLDLIDLKYIDVPDKDLEKCIVRKGDILFNRTNSKELVGKTALFDLNEKMIIAGYIIRVRVNEHDVLPIYVVRYMNTPYMKSYFRALCKGAVNQANINSKELKAIPIPLPHLALQQAFASKIEAIEKQKELIKKTIEEVETLFNSRMEYYFN